MTDKATSPSVEELEAALAAAQAARRQADDERRKAQHLAWQTLAADPASWEWQVVPAKPWSRDDPQDGLHVACRIKPELLEAWRAGGPATFSASHQEGRWLGMVYHRTEEGILTHSGGGHCVLRDPVLCSDWQWAELRQGVVPVKWQRAVNFA